MEEENRRGSWASFFIKGIIVIIFVLFTVWLLSLSNRGISDKLDILTDKIFAENIDRMKEVGKSYFTTERLPEKIGEVKTLTLAKMYDEKLILEIKDKNGNACSAVNSYVSVEKMENEYRMKVYLECGEESDYIIVIMGCYDYCKTDICERREEVKPNPVTPTPTSNYTEYEYKKTTGGNWTDWGNWYAWSKIEVSSTDYRQVESKTVKENYSYDTKVTDTRYANYNVSCPSGYSLSNGVCVKTVKSVKTSDPICPSTLDGYTLVSRNGFTCNYSLKTTSTSEPICANKYGNGTYTSISNFTCYYKVSGSCQKVEYQELTTKYCGTVACGQYYVTKYKNVCSPDKTISTSASCKTGYTNINGICTLTSTKNMSASNATCPSGYSKDGSTCSKTITSTQTKDVVKTCPSGYKATSDNSKCYQNYEKTVTVTKTRDVIYYRYRLREYISGIVDIKWSRSNSDSSLLNNGYKLTGNTRTVSGK